MKIIENSILYFGTTKSTLQHIKQNGLSSVYTKTRDYDAWLGDIGIYLTLNRPYIAYHFAKQKAFKTKDEKAVILEAEIDTSLIADNEVLDLTSESGMYLLWDKYIDLDAQINGNPYLGSNNQTSINTSSYFQSLSKTTLNTEIQNIDCIAITEIVTNNKIKVIIGIFQEGDSYAKTLTGKANKKYDNIPGYKGILSRTHIEICVTHPSLVSFKKEFTKDDIVNILNIGSDTQKEKYIDFLTSSVSHKPDFS